MTPDQSINHSIAPVLETSRLRLRGFRAEDFDSWFAFSRTPAYYRYFGNEPMPAEEVWKLLLRSAGHWVIMGFGFWAVEELPYPAGTGPMPRPRSSAGPPRR